MNNLSDKKILSRLADKNIKIFLYQSVDSTNNRAKSYAMSDEFSQSTPCLFFAEEQTAGRGRIGRSFYSPNKTGLYMSYLYASQGDMTNAVKITTAAAVAVSLAIEKVTGAEVGIKWVNDIYLREKKICGILAESIPLSGESHAIVVGIGINVSTSDFPSGLSEKAGSLEVDADRNLLAALIVDKLREYSVDGLSAAVMQEYRRRFILTGKQVTLSDSEGKTYGTVIGVDDDGALILRRDSDGAILNISSGEVSVRLAK